MLFLCENISFFHLSRESPDWLFSLCASYVLLLTGTPREPLERVIYSEVKTRRSGTASLYIKIFHYAAGNYRSTWFLDNRLPWLASSEYQSVHTLVKMPGFHDIIKWHHNQFKRFLVFSWHLSYTILKKNLPRKVALLVHTRDLIVYESLSFIAIHQSSYGKVYSRLHLYLIMLCLLTFLTKVLNICQITTPSLVHSSLLVFVVQNHLHFLFFYFFILILCVPLDF